MSRWLIRSELRDSVTLPALSGLLLGLCFPPLPAGFLAYIGLIPLIVSLRDCLFWESVRRGLIFAVVYHLVSLHFIVFNSGATPFLAAGSYFGLVLIMLPSGPLFAVPAALAMRRWGDWGVLAVPFFWSSIEYLRSLGEVAFPWNILPLSQADFLAPIQMVSITGVWGLSFWISGVNALLYLAVRRNRVLFIAVFLWSALPFITGYIILSRPPASLSKMKVTIVQGNVDPVEKWTRGLSYSLNLYRNLTLGAAEEDCDFVLWPETAAPAHLRSQLRARRTLRTLADDIACPIVTGALDSRMDDEGIYRRYNSLFMAHPDGSLESYNKIHLVPFGERVPFQSLFPSLGKLNFGQAEFTPGDDYHLFQVGEARFGGLICFESVMPGLSRRYAQEGADFLVNVTNDGWYGKTVEPYQHALLTRFRAVENRRSLLRAANTGISYVIDGQGRFLGRTGLQEREVLQLEFPLYKGETFYKKYGDIFIYPVIALAILILVIALCGGRSRIRLFVLLSISALILLAKPSQGEDRFLTLSTSSSRRLALGGPAVMEGNAAETPLNPAGFGAFKEAGGLKVRLFFNLSGPFAAANGLCADNAYDDLSESEKAVTALSFLIKGVSLSYKVADIGMVLGEQLPGDLQSKQFFRYYPLFDKYYNRAFFRLRLNPRVLVGFSAELFTQDHKVGKVGYSYGVILKPGKFSAGVFYYILPEKHSAVLMSSDRIVNETINAGISWEPSSLVKLYADFRNLSEESRPAFLEPHAGVEMFPWRHLSLRAGFYAPDGSDGVYSFGVGLLDQCEFRALDDKSLARETVVDYSLSIMPDKVFLHTFALHIGF